MASACSGTTANTSESSAPSAATKQIQHAFGATDVPTNPMRIVVLGHFTVEALMALGVQPIAASGIIIDNLLHLPTTEHEMADIGSPRDPSLEKLASLKPDLILSTKDVTEDNVYPLLSKIAPTIVFDVDGFVNWQELTSLCAEVLGKEAEAAQLEADYGAKVQKLRTKLSEDVSQIQVSVASFYAQQISAFGRQTFIGTILEDVGLSRPSKQAEGGSVQIPIELLTDIDGDVLFVMKPQSQTEIAEDVRTALNEMQATPLWKQLNAVQTNRVYEVDTYWFGTGYIAANLVLDDLLKYIIKGF